MSDVWRFDGGVVYKQGWATRGTNLTSHRRFHRGDAPESTLDFAALLEAIGPPPIYKRKRFWGWK